MHFLSVPFPNPAVSMTSVVSIAFPPQTYTWAPCGCAQLPCSDVPLSSFLAGVMAVSPLPDTWHLLSATGDPGWGEGRSGQSHWSRVTISFTLFLKRRLSL